MFVLALLLAAFSRIQTSRAATTQAPQAPEALYWYQCNSPNHIGLFTDRVSRQHVLVVDGELIARLVGDNARLLIKMDAEGFEAKILAGLEPLIRRQRPMIILEVLPMFCAVSTVLTDGIAISWSSVSPLTV